MKKLLLFLIIFLTVGNAVAANYYVFKKVGDVRVVCNGKTISLEEKMKLQGKDVLYIGTNSSATLIDNKRKQVIILKKEGQGQVKNLIKGNSSFAEIIKPIKNFFKYISGLCSSDFVNEQNELLRGVSERGDSKEARQEEECLNIVLDIIEKSQP